MHAQRHSPANFFQNRKETLMEKNLFLELLNVLRLSESAGTQVVPKSSSVFAHGYVCGIIASKDAMTVRNRVNCLWPRHWIQSISGFRVTQPGDLSVMRTVAMFFFVCACTNMTSAGNLLPGVVNTQNPNDISLSPRESLKRIAVPDGFRVTLFASDPDVRRPTAFDFDDRGRLWVVENYSHPECK